MEITVEKPSELERCLKISLPEDLLEGKVVSRLTDLQKTARLDGFRKGKIPPKIVSQEMFRVKSCIIFPLNITFNLYDVPKLTISLSNPFSGVDLTTPGSQSGAFEKSEMKSNT